MIFNPIYLAIGHSDFLGGLQLRSVYVFLAVAVFSSALASEETLSQTVSAHVARVYAMSKFCPSLVGNGPLIERALKSVGSTVEAAMSTKEANEAIEETATFFKGKSRDYICTSALMLYGPEGSAFPGLMLQKPKQ